MKQFIHRILMLFGLMTGLAASASAYEPIFVQGRVWEYFVNKEWGRKYPNKFTVDGTVEKFGKTYQIVRRISPAIDTIALVREEDGKVWRLASSLWQITKTDLPGWPMEYPTDSTEYLLYDLHLQKGDSISQVSNDDMYLQLIKDYIHVDKTDSVQTSKGMMKRLHFIDPKYPEYSTWSVIEGLGYVLNGSLHGPYLGSICCDILEPYPLWINRVIDPDGSVVYTGPQYDPSLVAGRKWVYWNANPADSRDGYFETMTLCEETTVDGTAYFPLRSDRNDGVAYLREKQNRIYRLLDDGSETLLYDFNMVDDDRYGCRRNKGGDFLIEISEYYLEDYCKWPRQYWKVTSPDSDGEKTAEAWLKAGVLKGGTFADFDFFDPARDITLLRVEDADGKQVFENKHSGVETITTGLPADGRMYDLMGREIREPRRGTVYIQDGRKKVKR